MICLCFCQISVCIEYYNDGLVMMSCVGRVDANGIDVLYDCA